MKKRMIVFCVTVFRVLYALVYAPMKLLPLQRKIVMLSRQSDDVRPDFLQIGEAVQAQDSAVKIVYLCRTFSGSLLRRLGYGIYLLRAAYHIATSRVCIVDGYSIPVSMLRHRKALYVIQVWHALGAIKKFSMQSVSRAQGRDRSLAEAMRMHQNYDCVLCASRRTAGIYSEAFGVPMEKMLMTGIPRIDTILRLDPAASRRAVEEKYPEVKGKKLVLYAPTFRRGSLLDPTPIVQAAEEAGLALIVRLHPLDIEKLEAAGIPPKGFTCPGFDTFTLMAAADAVITDYSALSIEASLLLKPIYFFVPDIADYTDEQGLNFDPAVEMPECTFTEPAPLMDALAGRPYDMDRLRRFRDEQVEIRDAGCTKRIADLIFAHLPL